MKQVKLNRATIERATEKAYYINIIWEHPDTMSCKIYSTWVPKSQSTFDDGIISVAKWLSDKIGDDIRLMAGLCKNLGGKGLIYL